MVGKLNPQISEWYQLEDGQSFEVVAIDHDEQTVEIQYFDGAIEEFDVNSWQQLQVESIAAPEDWSGSMDMMREDISLANGRVYQENMTDPVAQVESLMLDDYPVYD